MLSDEIRRLAGNLETLRADDGSLRFAAPAATALTGVVEAMAGAALHLEQLAYPHLAETALATDKVVLFRPAKPVVIIAETPSEGDAA